MVRFSDMLGGDGESDDARAATAARDLPPLVDEEPADPDAPLDEAQSAQGVEAEPASFPDPTPQDVLDRLTQYATATRAAPPLPEPEPEPPVAAAAPAEPTPPEPAAPSPSKADDDTGDDILPRGKRSLRTPRGKRRDA